MSTNLGTVRPPAPVKPRPICLVCPPHGPSQRAQLWQVETNRDGRELQLCTQSTPHTVVAGNTIDTNRLG
jgi:hypothetical protein